ncbi:hypothetical protein DBV05_g4724 [Lasiodiplodia theobromae]|uniref:Uncharacterized protein n=1 Tax=Lasiodiplodia theobromae TaxID=45133 RepID=A0A5N5DID4_9PEZI|nr:hypothetical protein DBV05_g4724 [Lasiodiplodia theobromae]
MASHSSSHAFPNPGFANSYQQQAAGRSTPMPVMSQPQSNNAGYLAPSAPHTQTPAMGYPTLRYHSMQADNARVGAVNNVALPIQAQNQQLRRFQAQQQQQLQQFLQWQKKQFATALQQQTLLQQQKQQFPQPNIQQQQQYRQSQTPAAFPNQSVPQTYYNNSQSNQVSQNNHVGQNNQVSNNNQVGYNNNQAGNSNNQAGETNNQVSYNNNQASDIINQASNPAPVAKVDISLDPGNLPPIPPLIEPHPLTKNFEDLRVLLHPIPTHVIERLSTTTASSLMRLCLDFEYRDLSADYPIALQLETKAWLMRYLRDLNAARRTSGVRLCRHWQKRLYEHHRQNPKTGLYEHVPDEVEVAGGTEKELKMLDHEAREVLGNTLALFEENKKVLIPLVHPDWKFLQLRQNRGPSAKEWEDFVVDDIGDLRRMKENAEREQREQEDAWNNQANGYGDVAIVGSRILSGEEVRMVAEQRTAVAAGPSSKHKRKPSSKNIASGSATPKKSSMKPKGQQKQNGRKKSLVAAKDKVTSQSSTPEADNLQLTSSPPPLPDYPDDYGTGNMATQRDKYSQIPVAASPAPSASVVASHNHAAMAALPSNNTAAQSASQLPDYPDIYAPAIQSTNQNTANAAGPNTPIPTVTITTPATAMPDYPPIYTTASTNQHNTAAAAGGPNTSAVTTTNTSASASPDYPPMYATASATETASISPSIQPAVSEADATPAADPLPQVDGGFDPEDDGLDDLFEGELDE